MYTFTVQSVQVRNNQLCTLLLYSLFRGPDQDLWVSGGQLLRLACTLDWTGGHMELDPIPANSFMIKLDKSFH